MLTLWSLQPRKYEMNTHVIIHLIITLEKSIIIHLIIIGEKYRMLYNIACFSPVKMGTVLVLLIRIVIKLKWYYK